MKDINHAHPADYVAPNPVATMQSVMRMPAPAAETEPGPAQEAGDLEAANAINASVIAELADARAEVAALTVERDELKESLAIATELLDAADEQLADLRARVGSQDDEPADASRGEPSTGRAPVTSPETSAPTGDPAGAETVPAAAETQPPAAEGAEADDLDDKDKHSYADIVEIAKALEVNAGGKREEIIERIRAKRAEGLANNGDV